MVVFLPFYDGCSNGRGSIIVMKEEVQGRQERDFRSLVEREGKGRERFMR